MDNLFLIQNGQPRQAGICQDYARLNLTYKLSFPPDTLANLLGRNTILLIKTPSSNRPKIFQ